MNDIDFEYKYFSLEEVFEYKFREFQNLTSNSSIHFNSKLIDCDYCILQKNFYFYIFHTCQMI